MSLQTIDAPASRSAANLNVDQAAHYLGVSVHFLNRGRIRGDGPAFYKLGGKVAYAKDDLDAWVSSRRRTSTSDVAA